MENKKTTSEAMKSWFGKWFLNNKTSIALLNILLVFILLFVFNQISFIFNPVTTFISAVLPAIFVAAVQYYLMNPVVNFMERKFKVPRIISIIVLFVLVVVVIIWAIITLIPAIQSQVQSLIDNWPTYWSGAERQIDYWLRNPEMAGLRENLQNYAEKIQATIWDSANSAIGETILRLSTAVNVVTVIFMTILTAPFILFFMLKDGRQLKQNLAKFFPIKYRDNITSLLVDINQSVAAYVRGQLTVAFWVGVMFAIGYSIIGLNYALTLAVIAAVLNLIPYFGTFIAFIPAIIIAMFDSTGMLFKVIIVFAIEQTVESRLISPLVLGNKMNMHPVTTIIVLIGGSAVSGLWGVLIAIPAYAVFKIIFQRVFDYYRVRSGLYEDDLVAEGIKSSDQSKESDHDSAENVSETIQK